ncbi:MAG: glycosyltransferase family 2 protein [Fimbriimonadaceae bacterium]|nr:glycosyltransferase family 2 protein [Fimbriimonadaceae bacterium]
MLSILIVNWNTREMLHACLSSIQKFPPSEDWEVIVVDNASTDGSAAMVREFFPEVTLIEPGANLGYAAGNNAAFEQAKGEWLLTLNPDTEFIDDSLQKAIDSLKAKPEYGALGARLIDPPASGKTQASVRGFPTLIGIFGDLTGLGRLFPRSALGSYRLLAFDYAKEGPAPQPMGTFLLFRREAVEAVAPGKPLRPFDESFPIFFNEVDLLERMAKAGGPTVYDPEVAVIHHGGQSTRQVRPAMIWESHRSLIKYLRKHSGPVKRVLVLPFVQCLIWLGALIRAKGWSAGFRP